MEDLNNLDNLMSDIDSLGISCLPKIEVKCPSEYFQINEDLEKKEILKFNKDQSIPFKIKEVRGHVADGYIQLYFIFGCGDIFSFEAQKIPKVNFIGFVQKSKYRLTYRISLKESTPVFGDRREIEALSLDMDRNEGIIISPLLHSLRRKFLENKEIFPTHKIKIRPEFYMFGPMNKKLPATKNKEKW